MMRNHRLSLWQHKRTWGMFAFTWFCCLTVKLSIQINPSSLVFMIIMCGGTSVDMLTVLTRAEKPNQACVHPCPTVFLCSHTFLTPTLNVTDHNWPTLLVVYWWSGKHPFTSALTRINRENTADQTSSFKLIQVLKTRSCCRCLA